VDSQTAFASCRANKPSHVGLQLADTETLTRQNVQCLFALMFTLHKVMMGSVSLLLAAMTTNVALFCGVTSRSPIDICKHFGWKFCIHLHS
jgi:hypothetical protein